MAQIIIAINTPSTAAELNNRVQPACGDKWKVLQRLAALTGAMAEGRVGSSMSIGIGAQASGTLTLASVVATNTAGVDGVTFTAIASGATGNQFNVGVDDTHTAANLAAVINASATTSTAVVAKSSGAIVTVTAINAGTAGNAIAITSGTNITASGAALTGGTEVDMATYTLSGVI